MSDGVSFRDGDLSAALLRGDVSEQILREIASLGSKDIDPSLENAMLMAIVDTKDARLRNLLSIALAKIQSHEAIPRLVSLLKDPKTLGYRSSILYALQKFNVRLSVSYLIFLILFDSPEVQEDALIMLEEAIPRSRYEDRLMALKWALDSLTTHANLGRPQVVFDALDLLLESLKN